LAKGRALTFFASRTKKLSEAKVYAEQEINKHRKDFEEKYQEEARKVRPSNDLVTRRVETIGER